MRILESSDSIVPKKSGNPYKHVKSVLSWYSLDTTNIILHTKLAQLPRLDCAQEKWKSLKAHENGVLYWYSLVTKNIILDTKLAQLPVAFLKKKHLISRLTCTYGPF